MHVHSFACEASYALQRSCIATTSATGEEALTTTEGVAEMDVDVAMLVELTPVTGPLMSVGSAGDAAPL